MSLPVYPADHVLGMEVPIGGSNCAKCEYLNEDGKTCRNKIFIAWDGPDKPKGSGKLPKPADRYCCDMYETSSPEETRSPHGFPSLREARNRAGEDDN